MSQLRVRFAPSPTGNLHVGHVRTALYNYLLAQGDDDGAYILRIEDTDTNRSTPESRAAIEEALRWLGLDWDEGPEKGGDYGPYVQSERYDSFRQAARGLMDSGAAYPCFCTKEELDAEREEARKAKQAYRYSGKCFRLTSEERQAKLEAGEPYVLRFRVPEGKTEWFEPTSRKQVSFDNEGLGDFVIWRMPSIEVGHPLYNFTVVVDDIAMKISHVLRGDDHISNTPRQIMLYKALGAEPPTFIHLSMILGADKAKLSKRHGATSLAEFKRMGYLPEGLVNYLALLGWNEGTEREVYSLKELVAAFTTERISNTAAMFDYDKCRHINGEQLRLLPKDERTRRALAILREEGVIPADLVEESEGWQRLVEIIAEVGDRAKLLTDYTFYVRPFYFAPDSYDEKAIKKVLRKEGAAEKLLRAGELFAAAESFDHDTLEQLFRDEAETQGVGMGKLIQPIRVALTGGTVGIGLFETVVLVGKDEVLRRLTACLEFVKTLG